MWLTRRAIQNNSGERRREIRKEFFCLNSRFWLFLKVFSQPKKKAIQKTSYSSIIALTLQLSASSCANMFWFCFVKLLLTTKLLNAHKIFKTNKNTFTSHFDLSLCKTAHGENAAETIAQFAIAIKENLKRFSKSKNRKEFNALCTYWKWPWICHRTVENIFIRERQMHWRQRPAIFVIVFLLTFSENGINHCFNQFQYSSRDREK